MTPAIKNLLLQYNEIRSLSDSVIGKVGQIKELLPQIIPLIDRIKEENRVTRYPSGQVHIADSVADR